MTASQHTIVCALWVCSFLSHSLANSPRPPPLALNARRRGLISSPLRCSHAATQPTPTPTPPSLQMRGSFLHDDAAALALNDHSPPVRTRPRHTLFSTSHPPCTTAPTLRPKPFSRRPSPPPRRSSTPVSTPTRAFSHATMRAIVRGHLAYDEVIHASVHDGARTSCVTPRMPPLRVQ